MAGTVGFIPFFFHSFLFFLQSHAFHQKEKWKAHVSANSTIFCLQRLCSLHSRFPESSRDGAGWDSWIYCWMLSSSWVWVSEQVWLYAGKCGCMKGYKSFSSRTTYPWSNLFICLLLFSSQKLSCKTYPTFFFFPVAEYIASLQFLLLLLLAISVILLYAYYCTDCP